MSSHPNRQADLEVWRDSRGAWTWTCWECPPRIDYGPDYTTHAEALAAALAHCAKATS